MKKKLLIIILIILLIAVAGGIVLNNFLVNKKVEQTDNQVVNLETEISIVEDYVRNNIKTIATDKPVLGGSWYVVSILIEDELKLGLVTYEDGHIQSSAMFEYEFNNETKEVVIKNFETKNL